MGYAKRGLAACLAGALACGRYDEAVTPGASDAGGDGGVAGSDAGEADADAGTDAGDDAAAYRVLGTGIDSPSQIAVDAVHVYYTLGRLAEVRRCSKTAGCAALSELVASGQSLPSGLAIGGGSVFWATAYRYIERCGTDGTMPCTPTQFVDAGSGSFPGALRVHGARLYFVVFAGDTRKLLTCPLSGCGGVGYPKTILTSAAGDALHGSNISDIAFDGSNVYMARRYGGLVRVSMTGDETIDASSMMVLTATPAPCNALDFDGSTLRWTLGGLGRVDQCTAPACTSVLTFHAGHVTPTGLASDEAAVYGADQGPLVDGGGIAADAGSLWRLSK
jgi:hypothetical protein